MRILVIPSWYGSDYKPNKGSFFREQAIAFAERGHEVAILHVHQFFLKDAWRYRWFSMGVREFDDNGLKVLIYYVPSLPFSHGLNAWIQLACGQCLFTRLQSRNWTPELVHLHSFRSGPIARWISAVQGIGYVMTEHSSAFFRKTFSDSERESIRNTFASARKRFAVSAALGKRLKHDFGMDFKIMPNFVRDDFFRIPKIRRDDENFVFLSVGYLKKIKNQALLIRAFSIAASTDPSIRLVIAGEGPEREPLRFLVGKLGVSGLVTFTGALDRETIASTMAISDAFVLSSSYETFGVVLIEAMSIGLPVVSTRCGGPEDLVISRDLGILCDAEEKALADALLCCRKTLYNNMQIRKYAYDNYSEDVIVARLTREYADAASILFHQSQNTTE